MTPRKRSLPHGLGVIYDFSVAGCTLPMHDHDETNTHINIVAMGSIRAHGPWGERTMKAGEVADIPAPHEFVALVDGSRLISVYVRGAA